MIATHYFFMHVEDLMQPFHPKTSLCLLFANFEQESNQFFKLSCSSYIFTLEELMTLNACYLIYVKVLASLTDTDNLLAFELKF